MIFEILFLISVVLFLSVVYVYVCIKTKRKQASLAVGKRYTDNFKSKNPWIKEDIYIISEIKSGWIRYRSSCNGFFMELSIEHFAESFKEIE